MTSRMLIGCAIALLTGAAGAYVLDKNGFNDQAAPASGAQPVLVTGAAASAVLTDDAGQPRVFADGAVVACGSGGILDGVPRHDIEWCSDGHGQTWTRPAKGAETIWILGGKVFASPQ